MKKQPSPFAPGVVVAALWIAGCSGESSPTDAVAGIEEARVVSNTHLGDPMDGLTADELAAFERGRKVFLQRFTPSTGLGPFYNATSCASCHSTPVPGGTSNLYRNFYIAVYGVGAGQSSAIAPFMSQVVPAFGTGNQHPGADFSLEGPRARIPDTVFGLPTIVAQRNSIPIFGTGMFEFVSDATILANSDPFDLNNDDVSGRPNTQTVEGTGFVGRFGQKAQVNNIELFTRGPLQFQMGITTDPFEGEDGLVSLCRTAVQVSQNPNDSTTDDDEVPDPEMSSEDLGDLIAFTRFLAPPRKRTFNDAAVRGEKLFDEIGCTICHVPSLDSSRGPVGAYTDLLIHDMGPDLADGIRFGDSGFTGNEFRTQPLWGIRHFGPYLHDGRAATLMEAIVAHGGEAEAIREDFENRSRPERNDIIAFLEHL